MEDYYKAIKGDTRSLDYSSNNGPTPQHPFTTRIEHREAQETIELASSGSGFMYTKSL